MTHNFWNERFWLPNNITWADLRDTPLAKYPQIEDLLIVIPIALAICVGRLVFERLVAQPIGTCIGISPRGPRKPYPNAILERVFLTITQKPDEKRLKGLEKQLDCWSQYRIKQWFALRRAQLRPPKMAKFKESLWKLTYYLSILGYGLYVLSDEDFFYDLSKCWQDYPFQPLTPSIRNYYVTQLSFYLSLSITQLVSVRRKSFRQLVAHHCITVLLLVFSYVDNFVRIGCIILIAHDIADVWLETVKLLNYTKCGRLTNFVFAIFAIHFFATRIIYFPCWIINTTLIQSLWLPNFGFFPAYVVFNVLLVGLLLLHVYWAILILYMGWSMFTCNNSNNTNASNNKVAQMYSDSSLSESEFQPGAVSDFHLQNQTYWFRITTSPPNGTSGGPGIPPGSPNTTGSSNNGPSSGSGVSQNGGGKMVNGGNSNNNSYNPSFEKGGLSSASLGHNTSSTTTGGSVAHHRNIPARRSSGGSSNGAHNHKAAGGSLSNGHTNAGGGAAVANSSPGGVSFPGGIISNGHFINNPFANGHIKH